MTETVYLVAADSVEWSEIIGVFSSPEAAEECRDWVAEQLMRAPYHEMETVNTKAWVVDGTIRRGTWRVWIDLTGEVYGDPSYEPSGSVIESYQMTRNDVPCGWAATGETMDGAYVLAREALNRDD